SSPLSSTNRASYVSSSTSFLPASSPSSYKTGSIGLSVASNVVTNGSNNSFDSSITATSLSPSSENISIIVCILEIPKINRRVIIVLIIKDFVFTFVIYVCEKIVQNLFIRGTNFLDKYVVQTWFFQVKFPDEANSLQCLEYTLGNIFIF